MMAKLASLSLSLAIQLSLSLATHASAPPIAKLDGGTLEGIRANNVSQFLGVPFAQSPHGARRWMPPAPYPPWRTTLDATQYKPACSQGGGGPSSSEDCLFLDIYSPVDLDDPGAAKLAVVVFVHGGGFRSGQSSGWPTGVPLTEGGGTFNGTFMAKAQQVVVVSINYRLGVFGFLGSKELSARTDGYGSGNFGIQNIDRFGGDKSRLMIHGCSAGGVSIANHLVQPLSWPFFTAAAMESGNMYAFTDAVSMSDAQSSFGDVLGSVGCDSIDCLLTKNTTELLRAHSVHAAPVVDGVNLADFPKALLREGKVKDVPTIVGAARDELAGLDAGGLAAYANLSAEGFRRWLRDQYGVEHVETMLKLYPVSSARVGAEGGPCAGDPPSSKRCTPYYYLVETIATDDALVCSARAVAELSPSGRTYQYLFAFPNPETGNNQPGTTTNFVGHCTQNAFVFGNTVVTGLPDDWPPSSNRVEALRMASFMSERWANLAKYGDPNGQSSEAKASSSSSSSSSSSIPRWESYSKAKDEAFVFGNTVATSGMRPNKKAQCDFLRWCRGNQSGHGSIGSPGMPGQPCTPIAAK